jgi:hypothetical protein
MNKTLDLDLIIQPESLAQQISQKYQTWKIGRKQKEDASLEVRNYVFATDTRTTTNAKLPWKNSTTRPKLCQIRDNLHANYMAALFPNDRWFSWEPGDETSDTKAKKLAIEAYAGYQLKASKFQQVVSQLVYDWIDYGNCFADVVATRQLKDNGDGTTSSIFVGAELVRISPLDIVFDINAPSFDKAPSITRSILSLGQIHKMHKTSPDWAKVASEIIAKLQNNRFTVSNRGAGFDYDKNKEAALTADGFNTLTSYYASGAVEVLEFEGDFFDVQSNKLYENYRIVVLDRAYVVLKEPITNWLGVRNKQHCGWRLRPDNAWAMGPLDNLVGLQYRLDHLENMRADIFDEIANPLLLCQGHVEDFDRVPGERVFLDLDASVKYLTPDVTALNADLQIQQIENTMEEMAGAPRNAMGIRTPGEKTAFEVQTLDNASGRLFQNKVSYLEDSFIDPLLNIYLEVSRRNLDDQVLVSVVSDDLGIREFLQITRADITAKGKLVPMGARHFAAQAQLVQNLVSLSNTGIYQDEAVKSHLSSKALAKLVTDALNLTKYNVYAENIRVTEELETQQLAHQAQEELAVQAITPTESAEPGTVEESNDPNETSSSGMVRRSYLR